MNTIIRVLLTAVLVLVIDYFMDDITVQSFTTSIIVAIVLGLLNIFVKPIIVFFTLPVTILTFGLFLLIINAIIVILCDKFVDGFVVNGFLSAIIFSVLLSISQSIVFSFTKDDK
jgi:putative membrane protein